MYNESNARFFYQVLDSLFVGNVIQTEDGSYYFLTWKDEAPIICEYIKTNEEGIVAYVKDFSFRELYSMIGHESCRIITKPVEELRYEETKD